MNDINDRIIDDYLDDQDAAADWTPETWYDPRPWMLYWRGLMTYDELQEHRACVDARQREYMEWVNESAAAIMAAMGW